MTPPLPAEQLLRRALACMAWVELPIMRARDGVSLVRPVGVPPPNITVHWTTGYDSAQEFLRVLNEIREAVRSSESADPEHQPIDADGLPIEAAAMERIEQLVAENRTLRDAAVSAAERAEAARSSESADLRLMRERKDAAYKERNQCVALIARLALAAGWRAGTARTAIEGWSDDWHGCVYIDLPTGQVSWHYHDSHEWMFSGLPVYPGAWDGHDTPEKYRRVNACIRIEGQASEHAVKGINAEYAAEGINAAPRQLTGEERAALDRAFEAGAEEVPTCRCPAGPGKDCSLSEQECRERMTETIEAAPARWETEVVRLINAGTISIGYAVAHFGLSYQRVYEVNKQLLPPEPAQKTPARRYVPPPPHKHTAGYCETCEYWDGETGTPTARDRMGRTKEAIEAPREQNERMRTAIEAVLTRLRSENVGRTHWDGCESTHPSCLMARMLEEALR